MPLIDLAARRAYQKKWLANRIANDPRCRRADHIRLTYGLTLEQEDAIKAAQGQVCALCKKPPKKNWCVDHDHETGRIRGLLCVLCNTALGHFGDNVEGMLKVIEYLKPPPT
jgi:hypothetical protein